MEEQLPTILWTPIRDYFTDELFLKKQVVCPDKSRILFKGNDLPFTNIL